MGADQPSAQLLPDSSPLWCEAAVIVGRGDDELNIGFGHGDGVVHVGAREQPRSTRSSSPITSSTSGSSKGASSPYDPAGDRSNPTQ